MTEPPDPRSKIKAKISELSEPVDLSEWNLHSLNLEIKLAARAANEALSTMLEEEAYCYFSGDYRDPTKLPLRLVLAVGDFMWEIDFGEAIDTLIERLEEQHEEPSELRPTVEALRQCVERLEAALKQAENDAGK
jgi:hypothetical protein